MFDILYLPQHTAVENKMWTMTSLTILYFISYLRKLLLIVEKKESVSLGARIYKATKSSCSLKLSCSEY